ncbi:MAG: thioredoxin family protein [Armatimonadota bacterium]
MNTGRTVLFTIIFATMVTIAAAQQLTPIVLQNSSFDQGVEANGLPKGWSRYAGSADATITVPAEGKAIVLDDTDPSAEIGVTQSMPIKGGTGYEVSVQVRGFVGRPTAGAYVQLRFLPSNEYVQGDLWTNLTTDFDEVTLRGYAPVNTTSAMIYLYTHKETTPKVMVTNVKLVSGVPPPAPPAPPPPDPVPPVYDKLKDLHSSIPLVSEGKPACSIVAPARYEVAAKALQSAIERRCGVKVPIIADSDASAVTPFVGNLIILGNRSTSKISSELYDRYYSLMDLKYPGPKGYAVRSLHNPYGNGFSAVLVGGSDDEGVAAGAKAFGDSLASAPAAKGHLSTGWTMLTKLGEGVVVPKDIKDFETWEASKGYGSVGYFGWCSISKRMAMYYMTGDPFHAREALRLSFPDAQAIKEIEEIDGERIENKKDPLAGPYHYNAMMMILYWDLIEESPAFSEVERLKVTNAFCRRLSHPQDKNTYNLNSTPANVSSRHGQWSAMSLYTLGRYFNKYYPSALWAHAQRAGELAFSSLHKHGWLTGESDNLFWYSTGLAPTITYLVMSGDRKPMENGVLAELLEGMDILVSGRIPDWALNYAALDFLNKTAYLTGDGRWLTYRQRTQVNTDIFRLGQSFWPDEKLQPSLPSDLCGKWSVLDMPRPMWASRGVSWGPDQSFQWMSYRSAPDAGGDYILFDGYNGASRNPYHTYDLLELRLNGKTLLAGYHNQVLTSADGMVEPLVPMNGQLLYRDVLGTTALAVGQVPNMPYCSWRRTLAQRTGKYALIADDFTFRADSQNMKINTTWQPVSGVWNPKDQALRVQAAGSAINLPGWVSYRAMEMKCTSSPAGSEHLVALDSLGVMILRAKETGQWLDMPFKVTSELSGEAFADMLNYTDRGTVRFLLDGKPVGQPFDHWGDGVQQVRAPLGAVKLAPGEHVLRVEVTGTHPGNDRCYVALTGLSIKTATPAKASVSQPATVKPVTTATFDAEILKNNKPTLVEFGADWCGPCRMMKPILDQAAAKYTGRLEVRTVDVDVNQGLAARYKVNSIPTMMVFVGGKLVDTVVGAVAADALWTRLDKFAAAPASADDESVSFFELRPSDVQETSGGSVINMDWVGKVKKGDQRHAFYLIGQNTDNAPQPLVCTQIAPNATALALPEPAVAIVGEYQKTKAGLAIIASDHLLGHNATQIGLGSALLTASNPIDVSWDFLAGTLEVVATKPTQITAGAAGDTFTVEVSEGRKTLTGHKLSDSSLSDALKALLAQGQSQRAAAVTVANGADTQKAPAWAPVATANIGARVTKIETLTGTNGPQIAFANDKVVHILTPDGQPVRRLETDARILSMRWWEKPRLLLVGCFDDKLIAFDENGNRKWVFTSLMDPAVYEAAKTYWFKTAPGHEGVRGLSTGTFLDGKEQAFLGGACTLEIVDENGQLVKRMATLWGPPSVFRLIDKPDGSIDLAFAREPTDGHYMYVLNNKTLKLRQGFHGVPSGHTYVGGWANMSRDHLFLADLDGDGKQEAISEINGAWNRITVWDLDGTKPLYNAQFGPGNPIPTRNMRDLDLLDLNGDGKPEIITATSAGLVVALDGKCEKLWSTRLQSPAMALVTIAAEGGRAPQIVVACENGAVLTLDSSGKVTREGKLPSAATKMELIKTANGPQVVVGTAKGEVAVFAP